MVEPSHVTPDSGRALLAKLGRRRDGVLDRIARLLEDDPRVGAAWLEGSFGRDMADEWSDLDIHVAVADESFDEFLRQRFSLYGAIGESLLVQDEMVAHAGDGGTFQLVVFAGPVEVDWTISPASKVRRPAASHLLFDRICVPLMDLAPLTAEQRKDRARKWLIFFWAMTPIAVKYAGRGETRRLPQQVALMSEAYAALWRLVHVPRCPEPWNPNVDNRPLEPELEASLPMLGVVIEPRSGLEVIAALCSRVEEMHPALTELGVDPPAVLAAEVRAMIGVANSVLKAGTPPRRRWR